MAITLAKKAMGYNNWDALLETDKVDMSITDRCGWVGGGVDGGVDVQVDPVGVGLGGGTRACVVLVGLVLVKREKEGVSALVCVRVWVGG